LGSEVERVSVSLWFSSSEYESLSPASTSDPLSDELATSVSVSIGVSVSRMPWSQFREELPLVMTPPEVKTCVPSIERIKKSDPGSLSV
jgi:hypothetical protein